MYLTYYKRQAEIEIAKEGKDGNTRSISVKRTKLETHADLTNETNYVYQFQKSITLTTTSDNLHIIIYHMIY